MDNRTENAASRFDFTVVEVLNSNPLDDENHNDHDHHHDDYEIEAHSTVVSVLNSEGVFTRPRWSVSAQRREMDKSTYYGKNETENQLETRRSIVNVNENWPNRVVVSVARDDLETLFCCLIFTRNLAYCLPTAVCALTLGLVLRNIYNT